MSQTCFWLFFFVVMWRWGASSEHLAGSPLSAVGLCQQQQQQRSCPTESLNKAVSFWHEICKKRTSSVMMTKMYLKHAEMRLTGEILCRLFPVMRSRNLQSFTQTELRCFIFTSPLLCFKRARNCRNHLHCSSETVIQSGEVRHGGRSRLGL